MLHEITRRFRIDAGHRVVGHESKCKNVHGHSYTILVTLTAETLDDVGRVEDFSNVKETIGGWLDEHWDHAMLLDPRDTELIQMLNKWEYKTYILNCPTTVEHLCHYLFDWIHQWLDSRVTRVTIYETPNCSATWPGGHHQ